MGDAPSGGPDRPAKPAQQAPGGDGPDAGEESIHPLYLLRVDAAQRRLEADAIKQRVAALTDLQTRLTQDIAATDAQLSEAKKNADDYRKQSPVLGEAFRELEFVSADLAKQLKAALGKAAGKIEKHRSDLAEKLKELKDEAKAKLDASEKAQKSAADKQKAVASAQEAYDALKARAKTVGDGLAQLKSLRDQAVKEGADPAQSYALVQEIAARLADLQVPLPEDAEAEMWDAVSRLQKARREFSKASSDAKEAEIIATTAKSRFEQKRAGAMEELLALAATVPVQA